MGNTIDLSQLTEVGKEIISSLETEKILLSTYRNLHFFVDAPVFVIGIYSKAAQGMDLYGIYQNETEIRKGFEPMIDQNRWAVRCFNDQTEFWVNNTRHNYELNVSNILFAGLNEIRKSLMYLPLTFRERKIGFLSVQSFHENAYQASHVEIIKNLATYITIALDNAEAYRLIEQQKQELIEKSEKIVQTNNSLEMQVKQRTQEVMLQKSALEEQARHLEKVNRELEMLSIVAKETENAIMIMDACGNVLWINDYFTKIYEYNYEDFIRVRGSNIMQTSFNPNIRQTIEKCISERVAVSYEALNVTLDGGKIWTHTTLTPVLDENGNIKNLVTIDSDITKRKAAEEQSIKQQKNITDSIRYARTIQTAISPTVEDLQEWFPQSFIWLKPRNIVSGDFFWFKHLGEKTLIAAVDCTGHGVPGAFMSMLGTAFLNEITSKNKPDIADGSFTAGQMLNKMRKLVKKSLRQNDIHSESKDGMDIALCIIDHKTWVVNYAGAYNPLIIYSDKEVTEYKGDHMPVGIHYHEAETFTDYFHPLCPGNRLYIFSDGYYSQFGGEHNHTFRYRKFRQLIADIQTCELANQQELLMNHFKSWKGNNEQVDDVLVIGIEV
jgi:PAS domain S-box-containing protein